MEYQKYQEQYTDKNIEWFFDNCPEIIDRIKEKINVNFQSNKINTKEIKQIYTDYINTFFSNHILVYRWDTPDLESFHYSEQIRKKWSLVMNYLKFWSGIYLTNNKWMADNFAKQNNWKLYYCFINKDNIISFNNKEEYDNHIKQYYNIERVTTLNRDDYTKILVEHKDRLTRFGFNYIEQFLNYKDQSIEVINLTVGDKNDLIEDFVSIITSFCARIYGQRRVKRKTEQIIKELTNEGD